VLQQDAVDWFGRKSFSGKITGVTDSAFHRLIYRDVNTGSSRLSIGGSGSTLKADIRAVYAVSRCAGRGQ